MVSIKRDDVTAFRTDIQAVSAEKKVQFDNQFDEMKKMQEQLKTWRTELATRRQQLFVELREVNELDANLEKKEQILVTMFL